MGKRSSPLDQEIPSRGNGRDLRKTRRVRKSQREVLRGLGVRSGLEDRVRQQLEERKIDYDYEPKEGLVRFTVPATERTYLPDFVIRRPDGTTTIVETKGRWTDDDRYKHLLIKRQHPHLDIRFVFSNPKSRIRKGSPTTYADLCEGRGRGVWKGLQWKYATGLIPDEWLEK